MYIAIFHHFNGDIYGIMGNESDIFIDLIGISLAHIRWANTGRKQKNWMR